jgi:uncharacterized protein YcbK (DUF882 family)
MPNYHRRDFLKIGLGALAGSLLPLKTITAAVGTDAASRGLSFYNTHTGERLNVLYYRQGDYCPEALARINHLLRDHRTGAVATIDTKLLDQLQAVKSLIQPHSPFQVISGFRSPLTNNRLRQSSSRVARRSFHTTGEAIDIRLPGYNTARLRDLCIQLKAGGVGYYPRSDFVHLDTGPVRAW